MHSAFHTPPKQSIFIPTHFSHQPLPPLPPSHLAKATRTHPLTLRLSKLSYIRNSVSSHIATLAAAHSAFSRTPKKAVFCGEGEGCAAGGADEDGIVPACFSFVIFRQSRECFFRAPQAICFLSPILFPLNSFCRFLLCPSHLAKAARTCPLTPPFQTLFHPKPHFFPHSRFSSGAFCFSRPPSNSFFHLVRLSKSSLRPRRAFHPILAFTLRPLALFPARCTQALPARQRARSRSKTGGARCVELVYEKTGKREPFCNRRAAGMQNIAANVK